MVLPTKVPSSNKIHNCRLFGLDIKGKDCGDEVAQWFTNSLKMQSYRLGQFETSLGTTKKLNPPENCLQNYEVDYPDCNPIHMICEVSMADPG